MDMVPTSTSDELKRNVNSAHPKTRSLVQWTEGGKQLEGTTFRTRRENTWNPSIPILLHHSVPAGPPSIHRWYRFFPLYRMYGGSLSPDALQQQCTVMCSLPDPSLSHGHHVILVCREFSVLILQCRMQFHRNSTDGWRCWGLMDLDLLLSKKPPPCQTKPLLLLGLQLQPCVC